jgi:DNA-binding CsgD family transcriptional regulator
MLQFDVLEACLSIDQLATEAGRAVASMGFDQWIYAPGVSRQSTADATPWSIGNCPGDVLRAFLACPRHTSAPQAAKYFQMGLPYAWDVCCDAAAIDHFDVLALEHQVACGLCVPVPGYGQEPGRLLMVAGTRLGGETLRAAGPAALVFSRYLHQACSPYVEQWRRQVEPRLTPREEECLSWASQGKTTWEISRLLAVSEHTVVYYFRNAMAKLGAVSRQHAVAHWVSTRGGRAPRHGALLRQAA